MRSEDANIHRAVEYRGRQIAKTLSWQKNEAWYGTANLQERTAEGVDYSGRYIKVGFSENLLIVPKTCKETIPNHVLLIYRNCNYQQNLVF